MGVDAGLAYLVLDHGDQLVAGEVKFNELVEKRGLAGTEKAAQDHQPRALKRGAVFYTRRFDAGGDAQQLVMSGVDGQRGLRPGGARCSSPGQHLGTQAIIRCLARRQATVGVSRQPSRRGLRSKHGIGSCLHCRGDSGRQNTEQIARQIKGGQVFLQTAGRHQPAAVRRGDSRRYANAAARRCGQRKAQRVFGMGQGQPHFGNGEER